ncbi:Protein TIC110, chloroplastic [Apostasia shenzhenica]|uniref:Protein TIC110, chloroplastic n=1 Tax=Apostasia shenzhenica TaxID=1088818 RepID=A0A2I0AVQ7_9ASPA|nr:Protein TIC110, chloroplastic [Apostasia shenzhenica]
MVNFAIISVKSGYNAILERTILNSFEKVIFTPHLCAKFLTLSSTSWTPESPNQLYHKKIGFILRPIYEDWAKWSDKVLAWGSARLQAHGFFGSHASESNDHSIERRSFSMVLPLKRVAEEEGAAAATALPAVKRACSDLNYESAVISLETELKRNHFLDQLAYGHEISYKKLYLAFKETERMFLHTHAKIYDDLEGLRRNSINWKDIPEEISVILTNDCLSCQKLLPVLRTHSDFLNWLDNGTSETHEFITHSLNLNCSLNSKSFMDVPDKFICDCKLLFDLPKELIKDCIVVILPKGIYKLVVMELCVISGMGYCAYLLNPYQRSHHCRPFGEPEPLGCWGANIYVCPRMRTVSMVDALPKVGLDKARTTPYRFAFCPSRPLNRCKEGRKERVTEMAEARKWVILSAMTVKKKRGSSPSADVPPPNKKRALEPPSEVEASPGPGATKAVLAFQEGAVVPVSNCSSLLLMVVLLASLMIMQVVNDAIAPLMVMMQLVRKVFLNYVQRSRGAGNRIEAAKELKKMIAFNTLVVIELMSDIKGGLVTTSSEPAKDDSKVSFVESAWWNTGLNPKEIGESHSNLAEQVFMKQAEVILADGQLTKSKINQLNEVQKQVGLPPEYAQNIKKNITTTKIAAAIETAVSQERIGIQRVRELKAASADLDSMIFEPSRENLFRKTVEIFSLGKGIFHEEEVYVKSQKSCLGTCQEEALKFTGPSCSSTLAKELRWSGFNARFLFEACSVFSPGFNARFLFEVCSVSSPGTWNITSILSSAARIDERCKTMQKLQQSVADGELSQEDVTIVLRIRVLCIPQ